MTIGLFFGYVCFAIALMAILVILRTAMRPVRRQRQPRYNQPDAHGRTPQLLREMAKLGISAEKPNKKKAKPNQSNDSPKYRELLGLLNGNREVADNLIRAYGVDKAIEDLIRDRR